MANAEQVSIISKGHLSWNAWRAKHPGAKIDLSLFDFRDIDISLMPALEQLDQEGKIPAGSSWSFIANEIVGYEVEPLNLTNANLSGANFSGCDLRSAHCAGANFSHANLIQANLGRANLSSCRFEETRLDHSNLRGADLSKSVFMKTEMQAADIAYASVYGVSAWDLIGELADESNLLVTPEGYAKLFVDSLSMAQFIYFLLNNSNARAAIDTLTTKVVLILGNFNEERKPILDAIKSRLRQLGFIPMLFDFTGPKSKDITGTVETLARLSRFVIADLTDPRSIPHELAVTVPFLRTTPVLLIREENAKGYSMISDLLAYPWVLDIQEYPSTASLVESLPQVIQPAIDLSEQYRK